MIPLTRMLGVFLIFLPRPVARWIQRQMMRFIWWRQRRRVRDRVAVIESGRPANPSR